MYIKQKNLETKTRLEKLRENREFFCKNILPKLNQLKCQSLARDFAFFVLNKEQSQSELQKHYYDSYSGQSEEKLFREAEEARLLDKNPYIVETVQLSTVKDEYKGLRNKELNELLNNPNKRVAMERALKKKFRTVNAKSKWELKKMEANREGLLDTIVEEGIDTKNAEANNYENLFKLTYDNPDPTEDEAAALDANADVNDPQNNFPLGKPGRAEKFSYEGDFSDYLIKNSNDSFLSAKIMRYENQLRAEEEEFLQKYSRKYAKAEFKEKELVVVPHLERTNDDMQEKLFKRNPLETFKGRKWSYTSELAHVHNFINDKVAQDSLRIGSDTTEEELNQVLFESQYLKPIEETDEYKRLEKKNFSEIEGLFAALKITPHEMWYHKDTPKGVLNQRPLMDFAQASDPLYYLVSEIEQPEALRKELKQWRKAVEIRTRLPYYPETKAPTEFFHLI